METNTNYAYVQAMFPELCSNIVKTIDKKLTKKLGDNKPSPELWNWKWVWNQVIIPDDNQESQHRQKQLEVLKKTDPEAYVQDLLDHKEIMFTLIANLQHVKFPRGLEDSVKSNYPENKNIPQEIIKHYTPDSFNWKGASVFLYNPENKFLEEHAVLGLVTKGEQSEAVLLPVSEVEGAFLVSKVNGVLHKGKSVGVLPFQDLMSQKDNRTFRDYKILNSQKGFEYLDNQKDWFVSEKIAVDLDQVQRTHLKPQSGSKRMKI